MNDSNGHPPTAEDRPDVPDVYELYLPGPDVEPRVEIRLRLNRRTGKITAHSGLHRSGERAKDGPYLSNIEGPDDLQPLTKYVRRHVDLNKYDIAMKLSCRLSEVVMCRAKLHLVPWPDIEPFAPQLPAFPVEALPHVLSEWVQAESIATQTPPDMAALLCLTVVAATIQREVVVEVRPGWIEPCSLYTVTALSSGNRKTAVLEDAKHPLREHEVKLMNDARDVVATAESELRRQRKALEAAEKKAANGSVADAALLREMAIELARAEEEAPHHPVLIVDDATPEAVAVVLAEQRGRVASMSAEGGVFDILAGLYARKGTTANLNVYLQAHAGETLIQHRVTRAPIRVERAALTCGYVVQPDVIAGIAGNSTFRGRGLLARFIYAVPASWVGRRNSNPPPVPETISNAYRCMVLNLAADVDRWSERGDGQPWRLHLAPEAARLLDAWMVEIETMLRDGEPLEMLRDWGGKLAGQTLRLAAAMHCIQEGLAGQISVETLTAAVLISGWAIPHADHALRQMAAADGHVVSDAEYLWRRIQVNGLSVLTRRDARRLGPRRWPRAEDVDPALAELVKRGYIRLAPTTEPAGPGRPRSPVYEVRPDVECDLSETVGTIATITPGEGDRPNCGNSGSAFRQIFGEHSDDEQPGCKDGEQAPIPDCPEAAAGTWEDDGYANGIGHG
jgi:hypothetical protein